MMLIKIHGLNLMKVIEEDMTRNCSRDDSDLAENMCPVIELLITGTHLLHTISILARLKCMFRLNGNREP